MDRNPQQLTMSSLRIVCIALIAGQVMFAGVVAFLVFGMESGGFGAPDLGVLSVVAAVFAVAVVPVAFLLRGARFARAAELEEPARFQAYAGTVIVFLALLEGASLFNIVAWMLTGELVPSLPVVVLLLAISLASFPSQAQFESLGK